MLQGARSAVRTSWVSVTLAAVLGVTMPLAATMAGTALASPVPAPSEVVATAGTHPRAVHDAAPPGHTAHPLSVRRATASTTRPKPDAWTHASAFGHVPAGGVAARPGPAAPPPPPRDAASP